MFDESNSSFAPKARVKLLLVASKPSYDFSLITLLFLMWVKAIFMIQSFNNIKSLNFKT